MAQVNDIPTFDFIVVGSGPAGCALASRLAKSSRSPKVLLLEAGAFDMEKDALVLANRYSNFRAFPAYNWQYKSAPQKHLNDRQIDYSRGRGLGGTSRINFACYTTGPKGDFDHWAELVGDDFFNWQNARRRYNTIESFDTNINPRYKMYADPTLAEHGSSGPVLVSFPETWERGVPEVIQAFHDSGVNINLDLNSGDPIGWGICPSAASKGMRTTGATAYLKDAPTNLTIITDSLATKIILEGKRAVGVVSGGKKYMASKEVLLSSGALDTPKLLMLSGIGPASELARFNIECLNPLEGVGRGMEDHWWIPLTLQLKDGANDRPSILNNVEVFAAARAEFEKNGTGPLAVLYQALDMGFWRPSEKLQASEEYKTLPTVAKRHLDRPTVPAWELCSHTPPLNPLADPTKSYLTFLLIGMVPQSRGTVKLASSDPKDAPICDPNVFSNNFDRQNLFEATREVWNILTAPPLAKETESVFSAPKSMSDEDIMAYARETAATTWHMSCTAKMGKEDDKVSVVDTQFRVKGLQGLRVADMSVTPFLPNCHPMSVAYQIGDMCAERLLEEYGPDQ